MNTNNPVYIASCRFTAQYPRVSKAIQGYVSGRLGMPVMRCCVKNYKTKEFENDMPDWYRPEWRQLPAYLDVREGDVVVSICHNCTAIFRERMPEVKIHSLWEFILNDADFSYRDYSRERMTVQDCWRSRDDRVEQDAVRALLRKMNIDIAEQKENREAVDFCGATLYSPAPPRNLKLAPKRYVENAAGKFVPHSEEEKKKLMEAHCSVITTEKVVAYCHYCASGLDIGGKTAIHLAELLFGPEGSA